MQRSPDPRPAGAAALFAAAAPSLLAFNVSPSPTFLNQALAIAAWGVFVLLLALDRAAGAPLGRAGARAAAVLAVLALLAGAALWSGLQGGLPSSLTWSAVGVLGAAAVLLLSGAAVASSERGPQVFFLFCLGWVVAGVLNAGIGIVQVFAPSVPDGDWIAVSGLRGRAVGNLRQPNHLSSLLLWSAIAVVACLGMRRLSRAAAALLMALLVFAVVLTASRTGLVGVALLALWGLADRRLAPYTRWLLVATPVLYAVCWLGMSAWANAATHTFGGQQRLAEPDLSASRFGIWANTLALIRAQPWAGVGFGEFNFAWSLTPFPGRPVAFFDHTHNLPLQLAVELGVPLAALVMGLLLWGLWQGWRRASRAEGDASTAGRCALAMLVLIGLHSLLEYPLWYSYFLLPAAWAWGFALGVPGGAGAPVPPLAVRAGSRAQPALALAGALVLLGGLVSVADYRRVAVIFSSDPGAPPLEQRIADGQRSVFFAHHAHYAAATVADDPARMLASFDQAAHYLLDTRLMTAWAEGLAGAGDLPRARHVADRLREFRNPASAGFFAECAVSEGSAAAAPAASAPFQCQPATQALGWRDFLPR
jgi:Virulence factor membrane-bound polymerase, C-terminal/O-Antigen ligase/Protein glycosylation ligase